MATREEMRPDIVEVMWDQYCKTIKYQRTKNDITVTMTFDEYLSLWTKHRIGTITKKKDQGPQALDFYFSGAFRPVCSWVSKKARVKGGVMTVEMAQIRSADESKKLFQFQKGDAHTDRAKKEIGDAKRGKPQSPEHIAKRNAARSATAARKRAEKEARNA